MCHYMQPCHSGGGDYPGIFRLGLIVWMCDFGGRVLELDWANAKASKTHYDQRTPQKYIHKNASTCLIVRRRR